MHSSITEEYASILERVLSLLKGARKSVNGWTASCPAHSDQHLSLSIGIGHEERILLHCHAGCPAEHITEALGLKMADLLPSSSSFSSRRVCSLLDFAAEKKLHWGFLINQGVVEESGGGLRITYY